MRAAETYRAARRNQWRGSGKSWNTFLYRPKRPVWNYIARGDGKITEVSA